MFKETEARKRLTAIVGPAIFMEIAKAVAWHFFVLGTPIVVIDAPTLYETEHLLAICSKVVVVAAEEKKQIERMLARDGLSEEQARDRIKAQLPVEDKAARASVVIRNNGTLDELRQAAGAVIDNLEGEFRRGLSVLWCGPAMLALVAVLVAIKFAR